MMGVETVGNFNVTKIGDNKYAVAVNNGNLGAYITDKAGVDALKEKYNKSKDTVEISEKADKKDLTTEKKQEIIQKARQKAAGYSVFGSFWSTLYYGLRSDEKVAKKYNLDPEKDKKLVKQIKREQVYSTLPALIPGWQLVGGTISYIYNRNLDPSDIKVKE